MNRSLYIVGFELLDRIVVASNFMLHWLRLDKYTGIFLLMRKFLWINSNTLEICHTLMFLSTWMSIVMLYRLLYQIMGTVSDWIGGCNKRGCRQPLLRPLSLGWREHLLTHFARCLHAATLNICAFIPFINRPTKKGVL